MDIALVSWDPVNSSLEYAGANNSLYYIHEKELIEIKGDPQPVGMYYDDLVKPFEKRQIKLYSGDQFFLFSDGFADQFGGPKNKKYRYKTFREKLLETSSLSSEEQKSTLEVSFNNWKEINDQTDDVLVIGVRV